MKIANESMQATIQNFTRQRVSNNGATEEDPTKSASFEFKIPKFDLVSSRKSAAKGRLDMLKRQLEGMLKFAGIGKSNVAAAARLAKQIAAAVAEYAGVSGGAVQPPTIAGTTTTTATAPTEAPAVENAGQEAQQAVQKAEQQVKEQEERQEEKQTSNPLAQKSGMSAEDRDFLDEARKIMQKAKLLLALEIQNSKKEIKTDKALYKDALKSMDDALKNATIALEQEGKQAADTPSVYAADGHTSPIQVSLPQISVQA
ncbi:hypothetical protein [Janthinobacterium sp. B9-8]|uniref:hypothetical protein n=1 Tax=Janthinobacterium sp. B9-8 TaxID=1236179 RepID=UPI00061CFE8C|nr:hypothetical protein [Janthinobacterium sp. B9-8]AMC34264.1 hypothetical protein VN23_06460 [Janthinobacterium sp. B9-8]